MDTRRSTSGILHKVGNSLIDWSSKLQPTLLLSTTKAKYRVLTNASKDVIHLRRLLQELGVDRTKPTQILSDNESCIKLVDNPVSHARTKHIEIQHHFIREQKKAGTTTVSYVPAYFQQADFLTKPLPFKLLSIGIKPLPEVIYPQPQHILLRTYHQTSRQIATQTLTLICTDLQ